MSRHSIFLVVALGLTSLAPQALSAPARPPISDQDRSAVVDAVEAAIKTGYVFPDRVTKIVERLEQARNSGRYNLDDPELLADRITDDLRAASQDRHLYLTYDPEQYTAVRSPATKDDDWEAVSRRLAMRDNHGLVEMRILPGNIRYLRISQFEWIEDETGAVYDAACRFLKSGDAIIIDLRGNPGGSHGAVRYLISHFMDGDTLELTFLWQGNDPKQSRTLEYLPAGRLKGKPLYVLIDGSVASAAEAFAYDVQQFKLGVLVGAKTVGAANNNELVPITPGFMVSVSRGRPVHAVSKTNWEGAGIEPDIKTPPQLALENAQLAALTRLSAAPNVSSEALAEYAWSRIAVDARLHPVAVTAGRLKVLAGQYGEVSIVFRNGTLWMERANRPTRRLTPLTNDGLFAVEGSEMLRVRFRPKAVETLWMGDPVPRTYPRT